MSTTTEANGKTPAIEVGKFLDDRKIGAYQLFLLSLCFLTVFLDGFNTQAIALAAPGIRRELVLDSSHLGAVFAAGTFGSLLAAIVVAPFGDRVGRRPMMILTVLASGVLSFSTIFSDTFVHLLALRLATGFFLILAVTAAQTYAAEIAPKRIAATAVIITSVGFGFGAALSGFLAGSLIANFAWRPIFDVGGAAMTVLGLGLAWLLPESPRFQSLRAGSQPQILRLLRRVAPEVTLRPETQFYLGEEAKPGVSIVNIFKEGRAGISIAVGTAFLLNAMAFYTYILWLPSLATGAGAGVEQGGDAIGWLKLGGILGSFACAAYMDRRRNPFPILTVLLTLGSLTSLMIGRVTTTGVSFIILAALAGVFVGGPTYGFAGVVARLYPTYLRNTGLLLAKLVGNIGATVGPFAVGFLVQGGWSGHDIFISLMAPLLLSALILVFVRGHAAPSQA